MRSVAVLVLIFVVAAPLRAQQPAYRLSSGATRIAMLPVSCGRDMPDDLCSALDESIGVELGRDPRLEILTPRDMIVMMGAQQLIELQACDGDDCFQGTSLASTQASFLVAVGIGRIGKDALITARVIDLKRGTVLDRDDIRVAHQNEAGIDEAARTLVQSILVRRGLATPLAAAEVTRGSAPIFWTGAALTGIGAAGVVVGGVFGFQALSDAQQLTLSSGLKRDEFSTRADSVRVKATGADIAFAAGGAAVVAGVVMMIVGSL